MKRTMVKKRCQNLIFFNVLLYLDSDEESLKDRLLKKREKKDKGYAYLNAGDTSEEELMESK